MSSTRNSTAIERIELFLNHNIDVDTKTYYLGGSGIDGEELGIDSTLAANAVKGLHTLNKIVGELPITLLINNIGGDYEHTLAIIGAIRSSSVPVHGVVLGQAQSAAMHILQECDWRILQEPGFLMAHYGSGVKDDHGDYLDNIYRDSIFQRIREKNPRYQLKTLEKNLRRDWIIYGEEALQLGLVDEVRA